MKANEAPEKIYLPTLLAANAVGFKVDGSIEYTRTDAFIEKAEEWMKKHGGIVDVMSFEMVRDFEKYMKGE